MAIVFIPGVKPQDVHKPRLFFAAFAKAGAVPPAAVNFYTGPILPMHKNDALGDCVIAGNAHIDEAEYYFGQGAQLTIPDTEVIAEYERVGGYNPNDPNSDQGCVIQDGLNDLLKTGLKAGTVAHKIAAFAEVVVTNMTEVKLAVAEFGAVSIGFDFPAFAMDQFNAGLPWDVSTKNTAIEGGHCVIVLGYDAKYIYVATWGTIQRMTFAFWNKYVTEAWAVISADWILAAQTDGSTAADLYALGAQYAALTGQPNPFPVGPPPPPPPTPVVDAAEKALAVAAHRWLGTSAGFFARLFGTSKPSPAYLVTALKAWLADKGL